MEFYAGPHTGEVAAILTAVFWTITALAFESASRKIGSLALNVIRLFAAFFLIGAFTLITRGQFFPSDASIHNWVWLGVSAFFGFLVGDWALFRAFILIGARMSMLLMATVPVMTAVIGWLFLHERLGPVSLTGMGLTIAGIAMAILGRNGEKEQQSGFHYAPKGVFLGLLAAFGQATGLIFSKYGMGDYDPFSATQIRVFCGFILFMFTIFALRRWPLIEQALRNKPAMKIMMIGAIFGPFLGISFSLISIQHTSTGIASTIMAITPVLIIPPAVLIYKEKLRWKEVIGAVFAVTGVALLFL